MVDFKAALWTYLTAQSTITDKVGMRIYPQLAPATAAMPYVTYQRIGYQGEKHLTANSALARAPYQLSIWGGNDAEAEDALIAIRDTIDGFRGLMDTVFVNRVIITNIIDGLEDPSDGQTLGVWQSIISADFWYKNA